MSKKGWKAGAVIAAGAGITAVLAAKKRGKQEKDQTKKTSHGNRSDYRNTELGKHDRNTRRIDGQLPTISQYDGNSGTGKQMATERGGTDQR